MKEWLKVYKHRGKHFIKVCQQGLIKSFTLNVLFSAFVSPIISFLFLSD